MLMSAVGLVVRKSEWGWAWWWVLWWGVAASCWSWSSMQGCWLRSIRGRWCGVRDFGITWRKDSMDLLPTIPTHQKDAFSHVPQEVLDTGNTSLHGSRDEGRRTILVRDIFLHTLLSPVFGVSHVTLVESVAHQQHLCLQRLSQILAVNRESHPHSFILKHLFGFT